LGFGSTGFILDHPLRGLGKPIMKNANPRRGVVGVSRMAETAMTERVAGNSRVSWIMKQKC
jgi:hypothetical protein